MPVSQRRAEMPSQERGCCSRAGGAGPGTRSQSGGEAGWVCPGGRAGQAELGLIPGTAPSRQPAGTQRSLPQRARPGGQAVVGPGTWVSFCKALLSLEAKRVGLEGAGPARGERQGWGPGLLDGEPSDTARPEWKSPREAGEKGPPGAGGRAAPQWPQPGRPLFGCH